LLILLARVIEKLVAHANDTFNTEILSEIIDELVGLQKQDILDEVGTR
jgi:hypothetical protein